uniref:Uncharacterized protein n=1 Tax=Anopheles maculatus TaxID=74869 RepID=A0A182SB27_9DIPT
MSSEKKLGYKTPHSPFLSKVTFHWIVPLLWRGYREPLELDDLGNLHEKDTSRYHYDQFLFIYQSYKVSWSTCFGCGSSSVMVIVLSFEEEFSLFVFASSECAMSFFVPKTLGLGRVWSSSFIDEL